MEGSEKRREKRYRRRLHVALEASGTKVGGYTTNLSPRGMLVASSLVFPPGTIARGRIELPDGSEIAIEAKVRWAVRVHGTFAVQHERSMGLELLGVVPPELLQLLDGAREEAGRIPTSALARARALTPPIPAPAARPRPPSTSSAGPPSAAPTPPPAPGARVPVPQAPGAPLASPPTPVPQPPASPATPTAVTTVAATPTTPVTTGTGATTPPPQASVAHAPVPQMPQAPVPQVPAPPAPPVPQMPVTPVPQPPVPSMPVAARTTPLPPVPGAPSSATQGKALTPPVPVLQMPLGRPYSPTPAPPQRAAPPPTPPPRTPAPAGSTLPLGLEGTAFLKLADPRSLTPTMVAALVEQAADDAIGARIPADLQGRGVSLTLTILDTEPLRAGSIVHALARVNQITGNGRVVELSIELSERGRPLASATLTRMLLKRR